MTQKIMNKPRPAGPVPGRKKESTMKTVNYLDYQRALDALSAGIDRRVEILDMGSGTIQLGVNFCAVPTLKPADAIAYAQEIQRAAQLAANFPLNGYRVIYEPVTN